MRSLFSQYFTNYIRINRSLLHLLASTEGRGFSYCFLRSLKLRNIQGCDFRYAVLESADFHNAIGGFSPVRPMLLLICLAGAFGIALSLYPELQAALADTYPIDGVALFLPIFILFAGLFVKVLLYLLYLKELPSKKEVKFLLPTHLYSMPVVFLPPALVILFHVLVSARSWFVVLTGAEITELLFVVSLIAFVLGLLIWRGFADILLFHTSFDHADLNCADFKGADLRNCSFKYANLSFADFTGANLQRANFKGALTDKAIGLEDLL